MKITCHIAGACCVAEHDFSCVCANSCGFVRFITVVGCLEVHLVSGRQFNEVRSMLSAPHTSVASHSEGRR